jgi:hypothetical protein
VIQLFPKSSGTVSTAHVKLDYTDVKLSLDDKYTFPGSSSKPALNPPLTSFMGLSRHFCMRTLLPPSSQPMIEICTSGESRHRSSLKLGPDSPFRLASNHDGIALVTAVPTPRAIACSVSRGHRVAEM